jgi:hypothetical protein
VIHQAVVGAAKPRVVGAAALVDVADEDGAGLGGAGRRCREVQQREVAFALCVRRLGVRSSRAYSRR